jgi:transposase
MKLQWQVSACLTALGTQLLGLKKQILVFDRIIMAWHRSNQTSKRLNCIPGVGPLLATALVASVPDPKVFRSGRNFSAWIGLVPKQHSSGGRDRLGSISKQGDAALRLHAELPMGGHNGPAADGRAKEDGLRCVLRESRV